MHPITVSGEIRELLLCLYEAGYYASSADHTESILERLCDMGFAVRVPPENDFALTSAALFFIEGYPGVSGTGLIEGLKSNLHGSIRSTCESAIAENPNCNVSDICQQIGDLSDDHTGLVRQIWRWTRSTGTKAAA